MADPVSIIGTALGLATVVTQVSTSLYKFIKAAKNVNETVKSLYAELDSLQHVVLSISAALKHPALASLQAAADRDQEKIWSAINRALRNCRKCVDNISQNLLTIQKKKTTFGGKAVTQMKLNMADADIKEYRAQSQSHLLHLSVALESINLQVTCLSQQGVSSLQQQMQALVDKLDQSQRDTDIRGTSHNPIVDKTTTGHDADHLHRSAERVLSKAKSIYEASLYEGSINEDSQSYVAPSTSLFEKIEEWKRDLEDVESIASDRSASTNETEETISISSDCGQPRRPQISYRSDGFNLVPTITASAKQAHFSRRVALCNALELFPSSITPHWQAAAEVRRFPILRVFDIMENHLEDMACEHDQIIVDVLRFLVKFEHDHLCFQDRRLLLWLANGWLSCIRFDECEYEASLVLLDQCGQDWAAIQDTQPDLAEIQPAKKFANALMDLRNCCCFWLRLPNTQDASDHHGVTDEDGNPVPEYYAATSHAATAASDNPDGFLSDELEYYLSDIQAMDLVKALLPKQTPRGIQDFLSEPPSDDWHLHDPVSQYWPPDAYLWGGYNKEWSRSIMLRQVLLAQDIDALAHLLRLGLDVNTVLTRNSETVAWLDKTHILASTVEAGWNMGAALLLCAGADPELAYTRAMIPNVTRSVFDPMGRGNQTLTCCLQTAVFLGQELTIKLLLHNGAHVNRVVNGLTALHITGSTLSKSGSSSAQLLCDHGADMSIRDWCHRKPKDVAVQMSNTDVVHIMDEHAKKQGAIVDPDHGPPDPAALLQIKPHQPYYNNNGMWSELKY